MGLLTCTSAGFGTSTNIAALQGATALWWYARIKVDGFRALANGHGASFLQIDDGTTPNRKFGCYVVNSPGLTFGYWVPASIGMATGIIPLATTALTAGRFVVFYGWYFDATTDHGIAVYDDSATNTLVDGLPTSTSLAWRTNTGNDGVLSTKTGAGIVHVNSGGDFSSGPLVIDCLAFGTTKRVPGTEDSMPTAAADGCVGLWYFDDTPGSSVAAHTTVGLDLALTAGQTSFSSGGTMLPGGAPSVATTVVVTPSTESIAMGGTATLSSVTNDQFGAPMAGRTRVYSSSATGVATVNSSTGVITPVAVGTCTITCADAPATSGTCAVTISAVVGTYSWVSSIPAAATVTTPGTTSTVTDVTAGAPTVTATRVGTALTASLVVNSAAAASGGGGGGGAGTPNLPAGFTTVFNSGAMLTSPSQVNGGSWTNGNVTMVNFAGPPAVLSKTPGGSGLRINYPTTMPAGGSPCRLGFGSINPPGTGWLYLSVFVRWSTPFSTTFVGYDIKFMEPQTMSEAGRGPGSNENHIIAQWNSANFTDYAAAFGTQGPTGVASRNLLPNLGPTGLISGGAWHQREILITPQSPAVSDNANGSYDEWLDNVHISHYTNVQWLDSTNIAGWGYLLMDPIYGGTGGVPPQNQYIDFDFLFLATK